jgi:hypothetical protein
VIRILAENGDQSQVQLDPMAKEAHQPVQGPDVTAIFNPNVGQYDVISEVGPAFATKREEAFNALTQIATQAPELMQVAGDLIMKAADFPMAEELAERLRNMVPAQALGGPSPQMQQLQGQLQACQKALESVTQHLADEKSRRTSVEQQKDIDVYKAETERMNTFKDVNPAALEPLVRQLVFEALSQNMNPVVAASITSMAANQNPVPGGQPGP